MDMARAEAATAISADEMNRRGGAFRDLSWRQAPAYAEQAARRVGARSEFVALPGGVANVRVKRLPMTPLGVALVSQGPAVSPAGAFDRVRYAAAIDALAAHYVRERGLVLRVQPPLYGGEAEDDFAALFADRGFVPLRQRGYRTILIDLAPELDALRRGLDGKWRTELSRAERNALEVVRSADPTDFDAFVPVFEELVSAKGFTPPQDVAFFRRVAETARDDGVDHVRLHVVRREGRVIAGHIGSFTGDTAVYLLGAANAEGRDLRAAYLLQWAAIAYAKERGQAFYDLGGIDEQANPDVFRFKKRMGGRTVEAAAGYELAPGPVAAAIVRTGEAAVRRLKTLRNGR
jgi:hypothetical protein